MKRPALPLRVKRLALFLLPVLVGVGIMIVARKHRVPPTILERGEVASTARVISVQALDVVPHAVGYGVAKPARVWKAVAEVSGKAIVVHPQLKRGAILDAGTVILEIDPSEYKLQIAQLEANIESFGAKLEELNVRETVDKTILATEQRSLQLKEKNLVRQQKLFQQEIVPETTLEEIERAMLTQRLKVQTAEKTVKLMPSQRRSLAAELANAQARLEEARLRLRYTKIATPFACRIAEVGVELGQFVSKGATLAVGDGIEVSEVHAQFSINELRLVIGEQGDASLLAQARKGALGTALQVSALVRFRSGEFTAEWPGRFARMSDVIDANTRTMDVILEVAKSYAQSRPGVRPPLIKGMHCTVELRGQVRSAQLVIPRHALHNGNWVYLLDKDNRLRKRVVGVAWQQGELAIVREGLTAGDVLVVSDLVPAIAGMLIDPKQDSDLADRVAAEARGETLNHD